MSGLSFTREFLKVIYNKKIMLEAELGETITMSEFIEECLMDHLKINLCEISKEKFSLNLKILGSQSDICENPDIIFNNYVYVYLDPLNKLEKTIKILIDGDLIEFEYMPFYIGKGYDNRMLDHLKLSDTDNNINKKERIKKILESGNDPIIKIIKNELTNVEALNLEKILISKLDNLTNIIKSKNNPILYKVDDYKSTLEYDKKKKIVDLLNLGKTNKDIANELKISERTIYRLKKGLKLVNL